MPGNDPPAPAVGRATLVAARDAAGNDAVDWPALIEAAGLKGPVGQLAQHANLIAIEHGVVRLSLKPAHEHFNSAPLAAVLEQKLGATLGRAIKLRFEKSGRKWKVVSLEPVRLFAPLSA